MLSICIPTYNRSGYLDTALSSIRSCLVSSTKMSEIEVVISDNNSDDATSDVVRKYAEDLPIVFSQNKVNIGAAGNLQRSTELAQGDYLWFLADDDILIEGSIDYLLEFLSLQPSVSYVFYPRILVNHDLSMSKHGMQPADVKEDVIFQCGKDLFAGFSGQMPSILGFFSSTIIGRQIWNDGCHAIAPLTGEFSYLKVILYAIADQRCAVLGKPGVLCRLQNRRPFGVNSMVWLDQYVDVFLFAKRLGYPHELVDAAISGVIKGFSKAFVIDKATGTRNGSIPESLSKLGVRPECRHFSLWYFASMLPKGVLSTSMRVALRLRRRRSIVCQ